MTSLGEFLARAKASVPHPSEAQERFLAKLDDLQTRLDEGRLRVAALGQFKRGKSTLLNALLGAPLLPMGVTPVTAIATFIRAGEKTCARIALSDSDKTIVTGEGDDVPHLLEQFISEANNPHNRRRVASVAIEAPSEFLAKGVILVDTPGVGSTFLHNTTAAEAAIAECDAALFVLSADPPITSVEVDYLEKVRKLIPRVFFVLNKTDLLDETEKCAAERFLASVLHERGFAAPDGVFCVSSRRGLRAKTESDARALEESGVAALERALACELAREKRAILDLTLRQRLEAIVGDLLFQSEFECKALLTPEEELRRKAETFESSAEKFEAERRRLGDLMSLDKKQLLRDLQAETDHVWAEAKAEVHRVIGEIDDSGVEWQQARKRIAKALAAYFEQALGQSVALFHDRMEALAGGHRDRAGALINLVRQTAADLMEIRAGPPPADEVFQTRREPYWVAPEPSVSLIDASANAASRLLPRSLRVRRAREKLVAEAEKAALRNVANLDWSLRQNIEDSVRRFENSLSGQLSLALQSTRDALRIALEKRSAWSAAIEADVAESRNAIAALSAIIAELQTAKPDLQTAGAPMC